MYTVSTVLFHKHWTEKVGFYDWSSKLSMLFPTRANVKLFDGKMGLAEVTGIILCWFTNYPVIYPAVLVYYCTCYPLKTISSVALKYYDEFQNKKIWTINIFWLLKSI